MSKKTSSKKTPKTPPVNSFMKALESFCQNYSAQHHVWCPARFNDDITSDYCDCGYQQALKTIVDAHLEAIDEAKDEARCEPDQFDGW